MSGRTDGPQRKPLSEARKREKDSGSITKSKPTNPTTSRSRENHGSGHGGKAGSAAENENGSDEYGQHWKHRSAGTNTQATPPPSPFKPLFADGTQGTPETPMTGTRSVMAETFDWLGEGQYHPVKNTKASTATASSLKEVRRKIKCRISPTNQRSNHRQHRRQNQESSSFLLFTQSFDTINESVDYPQDLHQHENYGRSATPEPTQLNPSTPGMKDGRPELGHNYSESDCSLFDVSPIRVAHGQRTHTASPSQAVGNFWLKSPLQYPPYPSRHTTQTSDPHMGMPAGPPHPVGSHVPPRLYGHDHHRRQHYSGGGDEHVSNPIFVIRSCQRTFIAYSYLLPCLRDNDLVTVNLNRHGHIRRYEGKSETMDVQSMDFVIATRRIETAICAFGGSLHERRPTRTGSIFRLKGDGSCRYQYEQKLSQRYHLGEGRISWEVEANPPISLAQNKIQTTDGNTEVSTTSVSVKNSPHLIVDDIIPGEKKPANGAASSPAPSTTSLENSDLPKMKYRCKLCGQLKQNHNCTFRQSLQRSIGVQVFSAVNAYTAHEPGSLAPALSKMNNFVSYDSSGHSNYPPLEEGNLPQGHPSTVTPQSVREGGMEIHSPQSSLSAHSQDMSPEGVLYSFGGNVATARGYHVQFSLGVPAGDRKRSHAQFLEGQGRPYHHHHMAFCPSVSLRPEHYRAVTPSKPGSRNDSGSKAYQYPPVVLTFAERKRLSDTLFYFCKEIPGMTTDCAAVLREAREKDDWDQAVAELLTQVVVGLYCGEGDIQLNGLKQYLLTLGVSC